MNKDNNHSHRSAKLPRYVLRFLRWFCPPHLLEEIEGDLIQKYEHDLKFKVSDTSKVSDTYIVRRAKRRLLWNTIRFFRPGIILRNKYSPRIKQLMMYQNYFKTTVRMLGRNKSYSFITVFGLAIGIASTILIMLWVENEYTTDHVFRNHQNIYQVKKNSTFNGIVNTDDELCLPVYQALKSTTASIKNTCYTGKTYGHNIYYKGKLFGREGLAVSEEFLKMFDLPLASGSVETALRDPYSIMLNETTAKEVFGNEDPIGKFIRWDNNIEMKVTAVFKDLPRNSTFWFHALVPTSFYEITDQWVTATGKDWNHFWYNVYVEIQPNAELDGVNDQVRMMLKPHMKDDLNREMFLQAMDRWYLYGNFENGKEAGGKIEYVRMFTWVAIFTLLIACINYMNLSTARSERRAKEIGIRKSIGSYRSEIIIQFLLESFLITLMAFVIAVVVVKLSMPAYNTLVHEKLVFNLWSTEFLTFTSILIGVTTLLAGCYPAFYFSSFQPIKVLKGKIQVGRSAVMPRNVLVTIQYAFAIFLVVSMIVINKQIQFAWNRQLGYDKENLVMIEFTDVLQKKYQFIRNELLNSGLIESLTRSNQAIYQNYYDEFVEWNGKETKNKVKFAYVSTDHNYVTTNRLKIIEGRDFSEKLMTDSSAVLLNRSAVNQIGYDNPIGKTIRFRNREWTIIGVVEDVVMDSPFERVDPLFIAMMGGYHQKLTARLTKNSDLSSQVKSLNSLLAKLNPEDIPEVMFADENYAHKFRTIELVGKLSNLFAGLAILLTALGVFGLAAYTAEQRTKEIAIRKVLGASLNSLLLLLSNYFIRIVFISILITAPISWWVMDNFLQSYSYRIDIPWWAIPVTSLIIFTITLLIVFTQVARTASVNPVNSLKNE